MQVARLRVVVQQSYIEYYAANNKIWYRAPGCYAGLLKNSSSEPGGLLAKKVSGDPWVRSVRVTLGSVRVTLGSVMVSLGLV